MINKSFFKRDAQTVAKALIGKTIEYNGKSAIITETEAYGSKDPFCYGVRYGKTANNKVSFMQGGHIFVYADMLMITTGNEDGDPQNVLIRKADNPKCNGPCNLRKYFNITKELNGKYVGDESGIYIFDGNNAAVGSKKRGKFNTAKTIEDYKRRAKISYEQSEKSVNKYYNIEWRFYIKKL